MKQIAVAPLARIDPLTSLRFFAALMIVLHHGESMTGSNWTRLNLGQGVSFFFVLSGFILTHVYPQLGTRGDTLRFLRARFARIWPAHIAALLLGAWLVPYAWDTATAISNVLLVHAWIPESTYYFSYNGVSWSVSTEAFFYLAFPLLIVGWQRWWIPKTLLAFCFLAALLWFVDGLDLPEYGSPLDEGGRQVTEHGLVYIHPLARIAEFILGMATATLWRRYRQPLPAWRATALELTAVATCLAFVTFSATLAHRAAEFSGNSSLGMWASHSGSLLGFAILIAVMANGGGLVSRVLSSRALVLGGEISFSLYLLHQILLTVLTRNLADLAHVPWPLVMGSYLAALFAASYLMWVWIEVPGRTLLLAGRRIHGAKPPLAGGHHHGPAGRGAIIAAALLMITVAGYQLALRPAPGFQPSDEVSAGSMTPDRYKPHVDASFDAFIRLAGADITCHGGAPSISLAWQKLGSREGIHTIAVHTVDASGAILGQADYLLADEVAGLATGSYWTDGTRIAPEQAPPAAVAIAVGVYDANGTMLSSTHPSTDWDGRRLILPMDACSSPRD